MNKRAIIGLIVIAVLMRNVALFGQSKVGTAASPFLGISVGPRATAMGAAFVAVSADASCLYYNPGGIAQLPGSQFMISHTNWLVGSKLNWLGVVLKLDGDNTIGASFTQLNYGEDLVTTVLQLKVLENYGAPAILLPGFLTPEISQIASRSAVPSNIFSKRSSTNRRMRLLSMSGCCSSPNSTI